MKKYKSIDECYIKGRGRIINVEIDKDDNLPEIGEVVTIDDVQYEIGGIETARYMVDPPYRSRNVGLVIREER